MGDRRWGWEFPLHCPGSECVILSENRLFVLNQGGKRRANGARVLSRSHSIWTKDWRLLLLHTGKVRPGGHHRNPPASAKVPARGSDDPGQGKGEQPQYLLLEL